MDSLFPKPLAVLLFVFWDRVARVGQGVSPFGINSLACSESSLFVRRISSMRVHLFGEWGNWEPRRTLSVEICGVPLLWFWAGHKAWEVGLLGIGARLYL